MLVGHEKTPLLDRGKAIKVASRYAVRRHFEGLRIVSEGRWRAPVKVPGELIEQDDKGKARTWAPLPAIEVAQRSSCDGLREAASDRFVNGGIGLEPEQCALRCLPRADTCISEPERKDVLGIDTQFGSRCRAARALSCPRQR